MCCVARHGMNPPHPVPRTPAHQGIREARHAIGELDGITTFCEMAVPLASRLAEKLGLPGNSPESVDNARDKVGLVNWCWQRFGRGLGRAGGVGVVAASWLPAFVMWVRAVG